MPDNDVKVKLKASLGMDASDVNKAMTALNEQLKTKAGGSSDSDIMKEVHQWLRKVMGTTGMYIDQRKKLIASYREELKLVKELEKGLKNAPPDQMVSTGNATADFAAADARDAARERQIKDAGLYAMRLKNNIDTLTAEGSAKGGGGLAGVAGFLLRRAPIIGGVAAGVAAVRMIKAKADEWSELSETMDVGYANLGRRMGVGTGIRGPMEGGSPGVVSPEMEALGYSGSDILKMGEAYSIPGKGLNRALLAQGGFARAYGFGQNAEEISGIGKRATQLGMENQDAFFRTMAEAVEHGQAAGIDASGSMKALLGLTEDVAEHTGVVAHQDLGGISGLVKAFTSTGSRFFKDERGAENIKGALDAFRSPSGIGMTRLINNSIASQFGDQMPTAEQLHLSGREAQIYKDKNATGQAEFIRDNPQRFPEIVAGHLRYMHAAFGGNPMMEQAGFDAYNQLSGAKSMAFQLGLRGNSRFPFLNEAETVEMGIRERRSAMEGVDPTAGITRLEKNMQARAAAAEGKSSTISMATQNLRTDWEVGMERGVQAVHGFVEALIQGADAIGWKIAEKRKIQDAYNAQQERLRSMGSSRAKQLAPSGN